MEALTRGPGMSANRERKGGKGARLGCWAEASWAAGKEGAGLQANFPWRGEGFLFFFLFFSLFQSHFQIHFKITLNYF
jgi:hypothetical protein